MNETSSDQSRYSSSNKEQAKRLFKRLRQDLKEMGGDLRTLSQDPAFNAVRASVGWKQRASQPGAPPPVSPGSKDYLDPVRFKKILSRVIKLLIIWELVADLLEGMTNDNWGPFLNDAIIAAILFFAWGKILSLIKDKREEYRLRMQTSQQQLKMKDAIIFSLLWSDEIFDSIPQDRQRIATISYSLIAIGIVVAVMHVGGKGLMPLALSGALVLAAVNLLVWLVSLERGEKDSLQTELRLAHEVQDSLMPVDAPSVPGLDIAGVSLPAQDVGGDLFDYSFTDSERKTIAIAVADVSGKGMKAAMASVFTMGAYASFITGVASPAEVLTKLNRAVFTRTTRGNFVAFLLMMIDTEAKRIRFANAGQTKPILKSGTTVRSLNGVGVNFAIGMQEDSPYNNAELEPSSGDVFFLLSDGFTEAMNLNKDFYGTERLDTFLTSLDTTEISAAQILEAVRNDVRLFTGPAPQHDDMTMVVIKIM